jgi:hypothetical protein
MRRSAGAICIIVALFLVAVAPPAQAATRIRVYKGETSQGHGIRFRVVRTDDGRFVREMGFGATLTCEDATTQEWGFGYGFSNTVPITDGAFTFDDVFVFQATHLAGEIGKLRGSGTLSVSVPSLTPDEQAQVCTTGDLTWDVEFDRIIVRT